MEKKLKRTLNFLSGYAIVSLLVFAYLLLGSFTNGDKKVSMEELTVKRINVVDEYGNLRMVISNEHRQHPGRINGKNMEPRKRPAGILFFNEEGDECGGLLYWGKQIDGTGRSGMSFTMDQYHNDQVVQIINDEYYGTHGRSNISRGVAINDIPLSANLGETMSRYRRLLNISDSAERRRRMDTLLDKEGIKNRMFMGRNEKEQYGLFLCDKKGRLRFRLFIDSLGSIGMEMIDTLGNVRNLMSE